MPRRSTPDLPPSRRQALVAELRMHGELEARAALDKYVHVSRAFDAGMTVRDIADVYGVSSSTTTRWKVWGEQERARRRQGDTEPG
jgi:transposase